MIKNEIEKVIAGQDLSLEEMTRCVLEIMSGEISEVHIASFLTALKAKGETISEITGGAKAMREKAEKVNLEDYYTVDTCGTGGDKSGTYNISTTVSIVAAAAGVTVVKHGNRSVSSKCGAADVLEELGIKVDLGPAQVEETVKEIGIGFFFAPVFHKAMKYVGKTRKELGFRTIFNILGPLTNPAHAKAQVLGVFDESLTEVMANVLLELGVKKALVVHGHNGLDEISITGETKVTELKDGKLETYYIKPEDFAMETATLADIQGGTKEDNAAIIRDVLSGKEGAKLDILLLNAGAALYVAEKADSILDGISLAREVIKEGKAIKKLETFIEKTNSFS